MPNSTVIQMSFFMNSRINYIYNAPNIFIDSATFCGVLLYVRVVISHSFEATLN